ncbi:MAG: hypothetical protein WC765_00675 [Phycisphaerae bacterium]|jgi:hypothetical protein
MTAFFRQIVHDLIIVRAIEQPPEAQRGLILVMFTGWPLRLFQPGKVKLEKYFIKPLT